MTDELTDTLLNLDQAALKASLAISKHTRPGPTSHEFVVLHRLQLALGEMGHALGVARAMLPKPELGPDRKGGNRQRATAVTLV